MPLYYSDDRVKLYHGDALEELKQLPDVVVQCCVTSPPYYALRKYLPDSDPLKDKEIGSEPTPEAFVQTMVDVFREVRRVMRDDGVLFLNLGDSYWGSWGNSGKRPELDGTTSSQRPKDSEYISRGGWDNHRERPQTSYKHTLYRQGDQMLIPHRVAMALQQDGWVLRQTIVWHKRSPMPESLYGWRWEQCRVKTGKIAGAGKQNTHPGSFTAMGGGIDVPIWSPCPGCRRCENTGGWILRKGSGRCTTAHEYIFVFSKGPKYFWDSEASKENVGTPVRRASDFRWNSYVNGVSRDNSAETATVRRGAKQVMHMGGRNPRSVWTMSSEPTKIRHFATFPSELVRRCLSAGVSPAGCCPTCGTAWAPMVESERIATRPGTGSKVHGTGDSEHGNRDPERHTTETRVLGYRPACQCPVDKPVGCVVLDPFSGVGTTGQTARHVGCNYIGIDINTEYLKASIGRIYEPPRWWLREQKKTRTRRRRVIRDGLIQRLLFQGEAVA